MKKIAIILFVLATSVSLKAQTISLGRITPLLCCPGGEVLVSYTANGNFNGDNDFIAQLSDASGSFSTFTDVGTWDALSGSIEVTLSNPGRYRMRVASTDPYVVSAPSADTIIVPVPPSPKPYVSQWGSTILAPPPFAIAAGFVGDPIVLKDYSSEPAGSTYSWTFNEDASMDTSTAASPAITYPTAGTKDGTLTVTNAAGCNTTSANFSFQVLSCNPVVPANALVITATEIETGGDSVVWVKSGGSYTADGIVQTVFADPGAIVSAAGDYAIFYLKPGSSFTFSGINREGFAAVVLNTGDEISFGDNACDTLYCSNLNFESPSSGVAVESAPQIIVRQSSNLLSVSGSSPINVRISNLLGAEMLSQQGSGALDVDLSPLPAGVYFAVVQAGNDREVKRIAIVH